MLISSMVLMHVMAECSHYFGGDGLESDPGMAIIGVRNVLSHRLMLFLSLFPLFRVG